MKIPKKIKVAGHWIDVKFPHVFTERGDIKGLAGLNVNKIYLEEKCNGEAYPESRVAEVFLHEMLHFVLQASTGQGMLGEDEGMHTVFASVLFQVLRDNKLNFGDTSWPRRSPSER
jgi:predicted SprT family Zn-dependent metalloprotease